MNTAGQPAHQWSSNWSVFALHATLGAAVYFLVASISLALSVPGAIISPLWPPAAIALVLCLRMGVQMALAVWIGAFLAFLWQGWDPLPALIAGAGSGFAAWAACILLNRFSCTSENFIFEGKLYRFILAAVLSAIVSAPLAIGGAVLGQRLGPDPWLGALTWVLGIATGTVIVTPLLRAWRLTSEIRWSRAKVVEASAFVVLFPIVVHLAFSDWFGTWPSTYLPVPFIIWAAYRFNVPAVAWSTALVCLVAAWNTVRGEGPFADAELNTALLLLVTYVSVIGIMGLTLASLIYQRGEAGRKLEYERDRLDMRVQARTSALSTELRERQRVEQQLAEAQRMARIGS